MEISKSDWKLYREKLPIWQEKYMERLTAEYIELLNSDKSTSDKFWELEERIYADKKKPGVCVSPTKNNMVFQLARLLYDGVISQADLEDFSYEIKEAVKIILQL